MARPRSKITRLRFRDPYKLLRVAALDVQAKQALAEKCDALAQENKTLAEKNVALTQNNNRLQQTESRYLERQEATRSKLRLEKQGIKKLERQRDSHILKCAELERRNLQLRKDLQDQESRIDAKLAEQEQLRKANREQQISIKELQEKLEASRSARLTSVEATVKRMLTQTSIFAHPQQNNVQRMDDEEPVDISWDGYDPDAFLNLPATAGSSDNQFTFW